MECDRLVGIDKKERDYSPCAGARKGGGDCERPEYIVTTQDEELMSIQGKERKGGWNGKAVKDGRI